METQYTFRERVQRWVENHPDIERWVRLVSPAFLYDALDDRLSFHDALTQALQKRIPSFARRRTLCLGGIALLLFINQIITGVLLAIYFKPSTEAAYSSLLFIEQQIPLGFLVRQMHVWGGSLMILFMLLHMTRVYFNRAYRPPRELTWVTGVVLMLVVFAFGFTGHLLPWDQPAYWGTALGGQLIGKIPLIGAVLLKIGWGGAHVSELTISRYFAVHCVILPWITTFLLVVHFMIIRRLGISKPM